jgi:hypothetical protein
MGVQNPLLSQACNLTAGKMPMLSNIEFTEDETSEVERLAVGRRVTELGPRRKESSMLMGFVHGNLRLPILIVCGDKLYLVDFDCGRKEIIATLPDVRLRPILREGRGDVRITKANDVGVLDDAKELLRGDIEKKRGKRRPAQNTHVLSQ